MSVGSLYGCAVAARDGDIGHVSEVNFDDEAWGVRYLVVHTRNRFHERQVLISPYSIKHSNPGSSAMQVHLTRQQVRDSADIDTHKPVSRQHEIEYLRYYGYPTYWGGLSLWRMGSYPGFGLTAATGNVPRTDLSADESP